MDWPEQLPSFTSKFTYSQYLFGAADTKMMSIDDDNRYNVFELFKVPPERRTRFKYGNNEIFNWKYVEWDGIRVCFDKLANIGAQPVFFLFRSK